MHQAVKERVRKTFSKAAPFYDEYAHIQLEAASRLIEKIEGGDFSRILELGCGSGNYTLMLRRVFAEAQILAIDFAQGMLKVASQKLNDQGIKFLLADGERLSINKERFELITSNCAFQWFRHLEEVIRKYRGLLKDEGVLHFSIFGPQSFRELKEVIGELFPGIHLPADQFLNADRIKKILRECFKEVRVEEIILTKRYEDLRNLLKTIRYTGGSGLGEAKGLFFTPSRIRKLEKTYLEKFGMIEASYQIFLYRGRR